jgi:hypothetical protein
MEVYADSEEVKEFELQLNDTAKGFLNEIAKWAYFLSILGYVGVGFIVLVAFFAGAFFAFIGNLTQETHNLGWIEGSFVSVIYFIIAAIYFFPIYFLNKFSSKLKMALKNNDSETLANSFENLKSHYKYVGIVALIILSLYTLFLLGMLIVVLTVGMS